MLIAIVTFGLAATVVNPVVAVVLAVLTFVALFWLAAVSTDALFELSERSRHATAWLGQSRMPSTPRRSSVDPGGDVSNRERTNWWFAASSCHGPRPFGVGALGRGIVCARLRVVHRDTRSSMFRLPVAKWGLACGFAYACPVKMPGEGGWNATVIGCSSDTPASLPRDKISLHSEMVLQHSVLTINTCMLTTGCRVQLEHGRAFAKHSPRAVLATS